MTVAKVKEQDGMTLAKVKEQDGMLAKVRHAQVSHAHTKVPSILHQRLARCVHLASFEN